MLLQGTKNPRQVAQNLLQRWRHRVLSEAEQVDCAQFLLAGGFYSLLYEQIARLASENLRIPWAQLVELLGTTHLKPDELEVRAIIEGAETQENGIQELFKSPYVDILDSSLAARREKLKNKKHLEIEEIKNELKEKLQFMRANRLIEQEKQVIEEIQALFPDVPEFALERQSFQLRWAREIIANSSTESEQKNDLPSDLYWKLDRLTPEQLKVKDLIVERAREFASEKPELAYDLAVSLHSMDMNTDAIEILKLGPDSSAADWLKLELMLFSRQFVSALDHSGELEIKYADDPDAAFAVIYARARALHGLGQTRMAIDLLRSLVRIRPHYKSAQSLLVTMLSETSEGDA